MYPAYVTVPAQVKGHEERPNNGWLLATNGLPCVYVIIIYLIYKLIWGDPQCRQQQTEESGRLPHKQLLMKFMVPRVHDPRWPTAAAAASASPERSSSSSCSWQCQNPGNLDGKFATWARQHSHRPPGYALHTPCHAIPGQRPAHSSMFAMWSFLAPPWRQWQCLAE